MIPYQPDESEIQHYATRLTSRWPQLADRARRAAGLVTRLQWSGDRWLCESSNGRNIYDLADGACDCPDFAHGAPNVAGRVWCKHRLALSLYRRIICDHITIRCETSGSYGQFVQAYLRPNPERYLYRDGLRVESGYPDLPRPLCRLSTNRHGWTLADDQLAAAADYVRRAQATETRDILPRQAETPPAPARPVDMSDLAFAAMMDARHMTAREWTEVYADKLHAI